MHRSMLPAMLIPFCYRGTSIMCRVGAIAGVVEGASRCLCQCKCLLEFLILHCPSAVLASCFPTAKSHWWGLVLPCNECRIVRIMCLLLLQQKH